MNSCYFLVFFSAASKYLKRYLKRNKLPVYICPTCGAQIFTEKGAKQHARRHTESAYKFQCTQCSKKFLLKSEYTRHPCMRASVFKCNTCDTVFKSRQGLQLHLQSSHMQKELTCKECRQQFMSSYEFHL